MPDDPFFNVEVLPIAHIGIPGHTGGFDHPDQRNYRMIVNTDDKTILGIIDRYTQHISNADIDDMINSTMASSGAFPLGQRVTTTHHRVFFSGREAHLAYEFPFFERTVNNVRYRLALQIRNSYDLSVNKYIMWGLYAKHMGEDNVLAHDFFLPGYPVRDFKYGKYNRIYSSIFHNFFTAADQNFDKFVDMYQAMNRIELTQADSGRIADEAGLNNWYLRRYRTALTDDDRFTLFNTLISIYFSHRNIGGSGKSSAVATYLRRINKVNTYLTIHYEPQIQEAYNEYITEAQNPDEGNDQRGDTGDNITAA